MAIFIHTAYDKYRHADDSAVYTNFFIQCIHPQDRINHRLTNGIRDAIQPDVTIFVRYVLQDNKIIRIEVGGSSYKTYYLRAQGLKPTGFSVRQGTTSVQASPDQIRRIFSLYKDSPVQPKIQVIHNTFKLIRPNVNASEQLIQTAVSEVATAPATVTPRMKMVLDYLAEYGQMTDKEPQELLNTKNCTYLIVRYMNEEGLI